MFYRCTLSGAPHYRSTLITTPHGFSTRVGGISRGKYTKSMNLAFGRGDDDDTVIKNFEILAKSICANPENGIMLGQVHSSEVMTVTKDDFGLGVHKKADKCLDGYVSCEPGALLCVRVADCIPVLFHDSKNNVIGAVHSGWRGSVGTISSVCIDKMCKLGAGISSIKAAIGPGICASCYTVGEDFVESCKSALPAALCEKFIKEKGGIYSADLKKLIFLTLLEAGLKEENIDVSTLCTCCNPDEFFSHRYHKENRGTMGAMIALAPERNHK